MKANFVYRIDNYFLKLNITSYVGDIQTPI